jgi:serine/threonine protein kinase
MICPTCKASNAEGARFCSGCGVELSERNTLAPEPLAPEEEITRLQSDRPAQEAILLDRESDPLLGSTIAGKYRIESKLGAGGMGAVYRATRLVIGDEVAVKILHSEQRDSTAPERFRREAQAAARLKHSNAVNIYDFGITDDGLQYLVMELVEGESLRRIIRQQGPVTPSACVEITNQVCAGLDEAHRHSIIHRDIKPDNIIVNVSATGLRVKVLDFGIAKLRDDVAGNLTQTGTMLGTPHYMSPEQCLGEELDSRADIYSLGVVLYEMLTGTVPFSSPTPAAVVVQHVNQSPARPRALNASIPESVESAVMHALEKRREDRPQSAGALAQELANALRNPNLPVPGATANGSANQFASTPTLVVDPQSFASGFATARNVERDTLGSNNRSNTTRVVGLTVLATVLLLGVGGLGLRMLLGTNGEGTKTASDGLNAQKNESASMSQPSDASQNLDNQTRFIVTSCNSIKDTQTLLEWFVGPDRDMTWYQAQQWTTALDNCDGRWRMPTTEEIRTLYEPTSKAGVGYFTDGKHFPAHISSVFNAIGGGSWVWANERVGDDARSVNLNQGKAVTYSANNTLYSTRAFAVRNFKK